MCPSVLVSRSCQFSERKTNKLSPSLDVLLNAAMRA